MRNLRYLNGILTVLAVLLAVNTWVLIAGSPAGALLSPTNEAHAQGVGGNAERQAQIVAELKQVNRAVDGLSKQLNSGIDVKVTSMPKSD
ncbi:MAG: hypothetical protein AAF328_09250 [Planctomycetota bacterium]